jgi:hypothetical protein
MFKINEEKMNLLKKVNLSIMVVAGSLFLGSAVFAADESNDGEYKENVAIKLESVAPIEEARRELQEELASGKATVAETAYLHEALGNKYLVGARTLADYEQVRFHFKAALASADLSMVSKGEINFYMGIMDLEGSDTGRYDWEAAKTYFQEALKDDRLSPILQHNAGEYMCLMETFGAKLAAGYKVYIEILFDAEGKITEFHGCSGISQVGGSVILFVRRDLH